MNRLSGKVALVAGAGRGIGNAIATLFAAEGASVACLSLTEANAAAAAKKITDAGGMAIGIACDITDREQVAAAIDTCVRELGALDILVNNAFDPSAVFSSILELTPAKLQRNLDMGPFAYLHLMQCCHPHLKRSGDGRVINLGSAAGVLGMPEYGAYGMAKEAVRSLTRTAAREWGKDGITVNNLLPIADTFGSDRPPLPNVADRNGLPAEDIAPVALFLASPDSRFITGTSISADGGMTIDAAR